MAVTATVLAGIAARQTASPSFGSAVARLSGGISLPYASGTGNGAADIVYGAKRSLAGGANEALDLVGVLTDAFGATINAAKVKAILIIADAANTGDIVVGGAAANQFVGPLGAAAQTIAVRPGGVLLAADPNGGWPVVAGTGDLLKIANAGSGAGSYQIEIVAASA